MKIKFNTENVEPRKALYQKPPFSKIFSTYDIKDFTAGDILDVLKWKSKPVGLPFDTIKLLAYSNPIIPAILQTRIHQVSAFWKPYDLTREIGFVVRLRDEKKQPTPAEEKMITFLENFIMYCGYVDRPRDKFHTFLKKFVYDTLLYDAVAIEIVRNKKGYPAEFLSIPSETIRVKVNEKGEKRYAQILEGKFVAEFEDGEIAYLVRNPRTEMEARGYGFSEIEMIWNLLTSITFAFDYNRRFFTHGSIPKGILFLHGADIDPAQLEAIQSIWLSQMLGNYASHRIPIFAHEKAKLEYIDIGKSNKEMEFSKWIEFLTLIVCAVYQIDPAEIGMPTKYTKGITYEGNVEKRIIASQERGLRALLSFIEEFINEYIIWEFSEDFIFEFRGLKSISEKERIDIDIKELSHFKTINEIRAEHDLPPIEGGDIILSPTYLQHLRELRTLLFTASEKQDEGKKIEKIIVKGNNVSGIQYINNNSQNKLSEKIDKYKEDLKFKNFERKIELYSPSPTAFVNLVLGLENLNNSKPK